MSYRVVFLNKRIADEFFFFWVNKYLKLRIPGLEACSWLYLYYISLWQNRHLMTDGELIDDRRTLGVLIWRWTGLGRWTALLSVLVAGRMIGGGELYKSFCVSILMTALVRSSSSSSLLNVLTKTFVKNLESILVLEISQSRLCALKDHS